MPIEGRRPCGKRLCGRIPLTGYVPGWNRQLFNRPDWFASLPIEGINIRLFGHLHNDLTAVRQIRQDRSGWVVPVPDVVVDQLVVPAALAGLDVQSDQGIRKKIVTGPIAAEAIAGGADITAAIEAASSAVLEAGFAKVDYVAVRDAVSLEPAGKYDGSQRILAAAWLGDVRLIDNRNI